MPTQSRTLAYFSVLAPLLAGTTLSSSAFAAPCAGPGAPTTTQTQCLTAVAIPGKPLRSYDISWVNPRRAEYYLADRSNSGIDVIDTQTLTFKRTIPGFVGVVLNGSGTVNNSKSGPDGVATHNRWLYAGDGDSTLKVIDLDAPNAGAIKQTISTGGSTRLDELALTSDGKSLIAANNAEDPPFATLFKANGDAATSSTSIVTKIVISNAIVPATFGLSIEQPAWDPKTKRFVTSIPVIANNPAGCNYGQLAGPITCDGGLLFTDPAGSVASIAAPGAFDPATNTGVFPLSQCGPNGASVRPGGNVILGCTPANNPSNKTTQVFNTVTKNFVNVGNITGSDEVWYNRGDDRYYTASSRNPGGAVLGVINAGSNLLIERIPQSSGSHSVATDASRNLIFVPESAPTVLGPGGAGDNTTVGQGICGTLTGCIAVYRHDVDRDDHDNDDND